ncbi:MAG: hypothetical protein U0166_08375 [Acidobacteriota bacterium]
MRQEVARVEGHGVTLPSVAVQYPPSLDLGDLALPLAFGLAKQLRRNPKEIAAELAAMPLDIPDRGASALRGSST